MISLACTSMSFVLTLSVVHKELFEGYPTITNDMVSSIISGIQSLIKYIKEEEGKDNIKIGLLTPYIKEIHNLNIEYLKSHKFNIICDKSLGLNNDSLTSALKKNI